MSHLHKLSLVASLAVHHRPVQAPRVPDDEHTQNLKTLSVSMLTSKISLIKIDETVIKYLFVCDSQQIYANHHITMSFKDASVLLNNMVTYFKFDFGQFNEYTQSVGYLLSDIRNSLKTPDDTRYYTLPIQKYDKLSFISMIICDLLRTQNEQTLQLAIKSVDSNEFVWIVSSICFHVIVPNDPVDATDLLNRDIKMKVRQDMHFMKHIVVNSFWCHDKRATKHWHELCQFIFNNISEFDVTIYENRIVLEHIIKEFARSLLNFTPILFNEKWKYTWPTDSALPMSSTIISRQCLEQLKLYYKIIPAEIV